VDQAHVLTEQAANALLKSLEEPPATSHVFLVTASPQALLPTIRSRCQTLRFGPLPQSVLIAHLRDRVGLAPEDARLRASLAGGSLGAALALESDEFRKLRDELLAILERAASFSVLERMEAAEALAEHTDLALVLTALRSLLRDAAALRAGAPAQSLLNADVADRLAAVARGPIGERAALVADAAEEARTALRGNAHKLLSVDALMETLAV
jgi:DNA polymerase-3 subunit delta'